jgi:hypothetical protein
MLIQKVDEEDGLSLSNITKTGFEAPEAPVEEEPIVD